MIDRFRVSYKSHALFLRRFSAPVDNSFISRDEYYVANAYQDHCEDPECIDPFRYQFCRKGLRIPRGVPSHLHNNASRVSAGYNHCHDRAPELDFSICLSAIRGLKCAVEDGIFLSIMSKYPCNPKTMPVWLRGDH